MLTAVVAFRYDRESARPLWSLPLQQFLYRQLMYLVVIESALRALMGTRHDWDRVHRTGGVRVDTAPAAQ
jgi:hypothetical protein